MKVTPIAFRCFHNLSFLILLIALYLGHPEWVLGADKMLQSFQLRNGDKVWGVLVRKYDNRLVVAVPFAIKDIPLKEVSMAGVISVEAAKVDELLTLIEDSIDVGKFNRALQKMDPLDIAISGFKKKAQPYIESKIDTANQRQECLKQAIEYYQNLRESLPISIRCLELVAKAKSLELSFTTLNYMEEDLSELITIRNRLEDLDNLTTRAEREKEKRLVSLEEMFIKAYDHLKPKAIEQFVVLGKTDKILNQFTLLKSGKGSTRIYEQRMLELVNECLNLCSEGRNKLSSAIDALLNNRGNASENQKTYDKTVTNLMSLTQLLEDVKNLLFGPRKVELRSRITRTIKNNRDVIASGSAYKELNTGVRSDLRQAQLLFEKKEYEEAFEQYKRLQTTTSDSNISSREILQEIEAGLIRSQGMLLLTQLRTETKKPADELNHLVSQAREFIQLHSHKFSSYDMSSNNLEKAIGQMKNYVKFLRRYDDFQNNNNSDPLQKWGRALIMSTWLESLGADIHDVALTTWNQFLEENESDLYEKAVREFFNKYTSLDQKEFKMMASFVRNRLSRKDPQGAFEVLGRSLFMIKEAAMDSLQKEIQGFVLDIANQFTETGQPEKAKSVYDLIKKADSEFSDKILQSDDIRSQLNKMAKWQLENNNLPEALETYEALASDHPEYAENENIYEKILNLLVKIKGVQNSGSDDELAIIETVCKKYPGFADKIPMVQNRSQEIIENFVGDWQQGNYGKAVDTYTEFSNQHPNMTAETKIIEQTLKKIKTKVYEASQSSSDSNKVIHGSLIQAVGKLNQKFPSISRENKLDELWVDLEMQIADKFIKNGQISRAFDIYNSILTNNKEIGEERGLEKKIDKLKWKYKAETMFAPIGITKLRDWIVFALLIIMWPILFLKSFNHGKKKGHLKYRLLHFTTVFAVFLVLTCGFVYGKFSFFNAFLFAFTLPAVCFQFIGTSTHFFFPLVYYERRIKIEKNILNILKKCTKKDAPSSNPMVKRLQGDIARMENDLPILHDRMLYKIEKAIQISSTKPEKGYEIFKELLKRLDQEIVKNDTWKKHYSTCLYNLGAIAHHLNLKEDALNYLNEHLQYDPKSIDARTILSEICFENEDFQEAIPHLKVCLTAYGNNDTFWLRLGQCYFHTGNYTSAYKCFSSMRKRDRNSLFLEARSYSKAGELNKATESYQTLFKEYPKDSEAVYYLASTLAHHGEDEKATKILSLINDDDPYYPLTRVLLANILYKSKRIKEANEMFVTALKIDPSCLQAMIGLGQIAMDVNKKDQALSLFDKALQVDKDDPAANYYTGMLIEIAGEKNAGQYYTQAAKSSDFKRFAERRLGLNYFFDHNHDQATAHLAVAVNSGEDAIWILYLYVYALATKKEFTPCQETLVKIAKSGQTDSFWKSKAGSAMYTLGLNLLEKNGFNLALKCFQFVQAKYPLPNQSTLIHVLIEESKFRMVIQLLDKGEFNKAQMTLAELIKESKDAERKNIYSYYVALCSLYQKQYNEAKQIFYSLHKKHKNNPRYLYHIVIAELGEGNDQEAAKLLIKLRDYVSMPEHLRVGVQMIRAYLIAKQGKMKHAEANLANIAEFNNHFSGADFIREQVLMARIYYLCHIRDSRKINDIIAQLTGHPKRKAILLHAIAAVESGQLKVAKDILKPHLEESEGNKKLYSTICTELAIKAISKKDYKGARTIFEEISDRSEVIEHISLLLNMAQLIQDINDFGSITKAIIELSDYLTKVEDIKLRHSLIHTLGILQLKRAIMAEEHEGIDMVDDLWQSCWQFWMQYIFKSRDYWNFEQTKFAGSGQVKKDFTQKEVEVIYKKFIDEHFVDMFIWYTITFLQDVNEQGVLRHIALLQMVANETGHTKDYFSKLREQYIALTKSMDKTDERYVSWQYYILSTTIECSISQALNLNNYQELVKKLENFKECSTKYSTPNDYKDVQKRFNTNLIEALHLGIDNKFADAGNKLEKLLNDNFSEILEEETIEKLISLREACRRLPKGGTKTGQLNKRFEEMYATVTGNRPDSESEF